MNALEIICQRISTEGFDISRDELIEEAVADVLAGRDVVLQYDNVVFTIGREAGDLHMYSTGAGTGLLKALRALSLYGWNYIPNDIVVTAIKDKTVAKIARRFGMAELARLPSGHIIFALRKPCHG